MTQLFSSDLEAACAKARSQDAASVQRITRLKRYLKYAGVAVIFAGVIALWPRAQLSPPKPWSTEDKTFIPEVEVRRAIPVEPEVRRATPVLMVGEHYYTNLPPEWGGLRVWVTFRGTVKAFKDIGTPHLGDMYKSLDTPGQTWVYCVPAGYTHPVWVDP